MDYVYLSQTALFKGSTAEETEKMVNCLQAREKKYKKEEMIYCAGDVATAIGLVQSGSILIENIDIWGNRSILDKIGKGQIFAETYACAIGEKMMVNVVAAEDAQILFLDVGRILNICPNSCPFHHKLLRNLLSVSAQKNLSLSRRIFNTSSKTIRGRLLSYLSYQALQNGSREFDIPYNRQQLADYLSVDRSAMSNELGKMQKEGIIKTERNHFTIKAQSQ